MEAILSSFLPLNCYVVNAKILSAEHEAGRSSSLFIKELSKKQIPEISLNTFFINYNCCCCCSTEDSIVVKTSIF